MFYQIKRNYSNRLLLIKQIMLLVSKISLFLLILISGIMFLVNKFSPDSLENFRVEVVDITDPVADFFVDFYDGVKLVFEQVDNIIHANTYSRQLQKTKDENFKLRLQVYNLQNENKSLQELVKYIPQRSQEVYSARITSRAPGSVVQSGYIKSKEIKKIEKDNVVTNKDGLVGQVESVADDYANIIMLSDRRSNIPVKCKNSGKRAILHGNGSEKPELTYLLTTKKLTVGEEILTSGDGGVFPADIPVGYIEKIENDRVFVSTYVDFESLDYVYILK